MDRLPQDISAILTEIPIDLGGGCSVSKGQLMAWLIRRYNLKTTLDIGVYRGRSLFPQALTHQQFTGGVVYGVDPWATSTAKQYDNLALRDWINKFVTEIDFEAIYTQVNSLRSRFGLEDHCILLRETSANAANYFQNKGIFFDLIHIDGNHDTKLVMMDTELYLPRLKKNGFIVLDDISWQSVLPAYQTLNSQLQLIYELPVNEDKARANDYAVFWNNSSRLSGAMLRLFLRYIGRRSQPK